MADTRIDENELSESIAVADYVPFIQIAEDPDDNEMLNITFEDFAAAVGVELDLAGSYQPLDADLTAIAALTTDAFGRGLLTKTTAAEVRTYIGAGTSSFDGAFSSLSGVPTTLAGYGITDAQGLDATLTALAAFNTNGILCQTAADTFAGRVLTGTPDKITVTNGDGVSGNPTVTIASTYAGQNTITTVGTIGAGEWQGAAIGDSYIASAATWNALVSFPGFGTDGSTACVGNDARLSDARTPVGTALTSAQLWVGNGSNVAAAVAVSGDVTISNAGVTAIGAGKVTLAMMADMATDSFIGRDTAGTGVPEVLSVSTVRTLLSISNVENTALSTWAGSANVTTVGTVTTGTWSATAVAVAKGGTGATDAATARDNLGLEIGADVQAYAANLTTFAGIAPSANVQSLLGAADYAAMRGLLDLEAGTDFYSISAADAAFQPLDAQLTSLAGLSYSGNGLKVVRVNAGATAFELADAAGTGDVVGPASSVDARIAVFDGTTGKLLADSGSVLADFAAASHNHAASDITSGTVATARLGSGTANSSVFLRGDQTWAAVDLSAYLPLAGGTMTGLLTIAQSTANSGGMAVTGYSLTGSSTVALLDLTGTWNTSGHATAIKLNLTDTAYGNQSKLIDLQQGGVSTFTVFAESGTVSNCVLGPFYSSFRTYVGNGSGAILGYNNAYNGGVFLGGSALLGWNSGDGSGACDLLFVRDAAAVSAQRNSTNAQTFRVYGTHTDGSNFVRASLAATATTVTLAAQTAGTGADDVDLILNPAGAGYLSTDGNAARTFWMQRHTTADTAGNDLTVQAGGATTGATDKNGGYLDLIGGIATGTGESGVRLKGYEAGGSGTSDNTPATVLEVLGNKLGFFGATPVVQQSALTASLTTLTHDAPGTPDYAVDTLTDTGGFGFTTADEGHTVLSVIANLQTRVNELETILQNLGITP